MLQAVPALGEQLSIEQLLDMAYERNPQLHESQYLAEAAQANAAAVATPASPTVGLGGIISDGSASHWTIGQKLEWPTKYSLRRGIEHSKSRAKSHELEQRRLTLRRSVITTYFGIYAVQRIAQLTRDDLAKVKEFSRIAETKYAAGQGPMQDSMKAHVLQTEIEADLLALRQEEEILHARLRAHLNQPPSFRLTSLPASIERPELDHSKDFDPSAFTPKSPLIDSKKEALVAASSAHELARWDYAPDFELKYQAPLPGVSHDRPSVSLGLSVPLWFWGKNAARRSARLTEQATQAALESTINDVQAQAYEAYTKVKNQGELLDVFKSSMIPQAQSSYQSSLDGYRANHVTFLSLVDAERSLLRVQIAYYRMLTQYVESLTSLEAALGYRVSKLAF